MEASLQASHRLRKSREELDGSKLLSAIAIHSPEKTLKLQADFDAYLDQVQRIQMAPLPSTKSLSSTKGLCWPMTVYYF